MNDAINNAFCAFVVLERVSGIEPPYLAWEASILPLNYTRVVKALVALLLISFLLFDEYTHHRLLVRDVFVA